MRWLAKIALQALRDMGPGNMRASLEWLAGAANTLK
jgi:hypothetical protein